MSTTFSYVNNFNINVGSATSTTTGTNVGIAQGSNTDTDTEYVFYSGTNERGTLDLNANMATGHRINDFSASMQLDFWAISQSGTQFGNRNPDGFSFSYGNPSTLAVNSEYGLSSGLTIQVLPFDWSTNGFAMNILWNGTVIGQTPLTGFSLANPAATLSIGVNASGQVTASWGSYTATGTIPGNQWLTTAQDGWDFILAGRTGANGDGAYIDNLAVNGTVVCFCAGTRIETDRGEVPVEELRAGDLVLTLDHGLQPLRWVSRRHLSATQLAANPKLRPIRIAQGTLGNGIPTSDLCLSPQHRLLARGPICERMFSDREVLVSARNLLATPGVMVDSEATSATYFHLLFEEHEIIFANGAPTESLLAAPGTLASLSPLHLGELVALVPGLLDPEFRLLPARPIPDASRQRKLAARAARNGHPVLADR